MSGERREFPRPVTRLLPGDRSSFGVLHIYDRINGGLFLLGPEEKDHLRELLDSLLDFCGLEMLTWCCLDNHYHLLLRAPNAAEAARRRAEISEPELYERMQTAFRTESIDDTRRRVEKARREGNPTHAEDILGRLRGQIFDVPKFMQMLKRRFSSWYNQRHSRRGTLWQSRYGSVLVEDEEDALLTMATYIDLNSVRAGLTGNPAEYRWCGYAEALAGRPSARAGITRIAEAAASQTLTWSEARSLYRQWLGGPEAETGAQTGEDPQPSDQGLPQDKLESALREGTNLSRAELLRCRVRYFSKGGAVGSPEFIEDVFANNRHRFGPQRTSGARPMRHGDWGNLCSLRDLRKDVLRGAEPEE